MAGNDSGNPNEAHAVWDEHYSAKPRVWSGRVNAQVAAAAVAAGGTLLIVDHGAAPPWATRLHHHHFPAAEAVLDGLGLDPLQWQRVRVGSVDRAAQGPDGADVTLLDNVILMRRTRGIV